MPRITLAQARADIERQGARCFESDRYGEGRKCGAKLKLLSVCPANHDTEVLAKWQCPICHHETETHHGYFLI